MADQDAYVTALSDAHVLVRGLPAPLGAALTEHADRLATLQAGQLAGLKGYATKAALDGDLTPPADSLALVTNDPNPGNNRTYRKSGAAGAGSWTPAGADRIDQVASRAGSAAARAGVAAALHSRFPNRWRGLAWETLGEADAVATTGENARELYQGRWSLRVAGTCSWRTDLPVRAGAIFSVSLILAEKTATVGARVLVIQRDNTAAEILAARATFSLPGAASTEALAVELPAIPVHANANSITVFLDAGSGGGWLRFVDPCACEGGTAGFRGYAEDPAVNLFPDPEFQGFGPLQNAYGRRMLSAGVAHLRIAMPPGTAVSSATVRTYDLPATGPLAPGQLVYAQADLRSDAGSSAVLRLIFLNSGGTEISRTSLSNSATGSWQTQRATVTVPDTAATVRVRFQQGTANGPTYADFARVLLGRSPPRFVRYLTALEGAVMPALPYFSLFPEPDFGTGGTGGSGGPTAASVLTEDGERTLVFAIATSTPSRSWYLPATGRLAPGRVVQAVIEARSDAVDGAELTLMFRDAADAEITGARVTRRNGAVTGAYVELRGTQTVPANAVRVQVRLVHWTTAGATVSKFRRPALLATADEPLLEQVWNLGAPSTQTGRHTAYIAPTGSDSTGDGSAASPFATANKALDALGGVGDLVVRAGEWAGLTIDAGQIRDLAIHGMETDTFTRPLVRFGTRLTGITKTAGRSKVYQSAISLAGPPNYLWQEGAADASTLVPLGEQHAGLRGRAHRLPCVRIQRAAATSTAAALAELDGAAEPRCFYDATTATLYFTVQGAGDPTAATIYVANTTGTLLTGAPGFWTPYPVTLRLAGLDVRYGSISTRAVARSFLLDCAVLGAPLNGFDIAWRADLDSCEAAGSGSFNTVNGDGFNWHNYAHCQHRHLYTHDNFDDGMSAHENCVEYGYRPVAEYNLGAGLAPAYGAHSVYIAPLTRKNSLHPWLGTENQGGIEVIGGPVAGDNGVATTCEVYGGVSIGDRSGLSDSYTRSSGSTPAVLQAYDVTVIDPVEYAVQCARYGNIRHVGSGTAKAAGAGALGVHNGTLVA